MSVFSIKMICGYSVALLSFVGFVSSFFGAHPGNMVEGLWALLSFAGWAQLAIGEHLDRKFLETRAENLLKRRKNV